MSEEVQNSQMWKGRLSKNAGNDAKDLDDILRVINTGPD